MLIRTILILTLIASSTVSHGQEDVRKARRILRQVSKNYKRAKTLKAEFEISIKEPNAKKATKETGKLYLKGDQFKVELNDVDIICDGTTQWTYMKGLNEVQIVNYDPDEREISPRNILTMYDNGFKYIWTGSKTVNGRVIDMIELVPKDDQEKKMYTKIKLEIDSKAKHILSSEILFRSGRIMKYTIKQQVENINLKAGFFKFDVKKHPGCTVVDLR